MKKKKVVSGSLNAHQNLRCIFESKYVLTSQKPVQKWARDEQRQCLIGTRLIQQLR